MFNNMNLFLTGGTGFFGRALLRFWKNTGSSFNKIFILSRNPKSFLKKHADLIAELNVEFIQGDILEASAIKLNENIDYLLHAATDSTIGPSLGRLKIFNQIVKGTEEILKFAVNHRCKRFLLTSSGAVYGPQPQDMDKILESYMGSPDPSDPNSAYGLGKRSAEHLCAIYSQQYGFEYVVARCFSFVGEDLPLENHFAIGNFLSAILCNKDIIIRGDGTPVRSYMHQSDLAFVLNKLLFSKTNHTVFNVGSDEAISIKDLAYLIKKIEIYNGDIKILSEDDNNLKNYYVPNIDRLRTFIGDYQLMSLERSINISLKNIQNKDSD